MLKDRAIFLTGGGTGLGRSMALHFATLGARIFLVGRREQPLKDVCDEIHRGGGAAAFATCDVRDYGAVEAVATRAYEQLGGNVLNIVTTYAAANCGSAFVVPSACAKAGVLAMTTSLAVEWAKYHIRLNAIAPGPFPTEGAWSRLMPSKQFEEHAKDSHPMKRFGRHEELTSLAAFLLSDMAEYINGECVVIDGGDWLRGAGEFNDLLLLPDAAWESMEAARTKK